MSPEPTNDQFDKFRFGEPAQLVGMRDQRANLPEVENRNTPYKVATLPDPIPGTAFGSDRQRFDEQRRLGNIPESVLAVTNPIGLNDEEAERQRQINDLLRNLQMGGRGATNITAEFGEALLEIDKSKENLEKVKVLYSEMINESMGAIFDLYEKNVKSDEKNAYPYDYRTAEYMQQNIKQAVTSLERRPEIKKSKEAQVVIAELKQDLVWLDSLLHTTVAMSASLPYKFDVVMQMQLLKEGRYRAFVPNDDMEALMSSEVPGMQLTPEQQALKEAKKIGIAIPEEYTKHVDDKGNLLEGKPLVEGPVSLREMAIKMFAASFKLRMNLAAASQADFASKNPEKTTFKGDHLTKEEIIFYKDLFWDSKEGQFLTPYTTSKGDHTREYTTLLESALVNNAYFRLKEIIKSGGTDDEKNIKINNLTKEVKREALTRRSNWRTRQDKDMVSMLATLLTQQGLLQDFSYGHSYKYCYEFQWKTDTNGNPTMKKGRELAGIYTWAGDYPSLGFAQRKHSYDGMGNSCTTFLLPTSRAGRKEASLMSPLEMPHFDIDKSQDEFLKEQWNFLFSNEPKYVEERKEMDYKSLHPKVADQLKKWAFKWTTPYSSKYLGEVKSYELVIPHLMPPSLGNIANFFDSITLGDTKLNIGGKSVFQELIEGKETYEMDWGRCEIQAHSRWMVDQDMASRYIKPLIEKVDETKDPLLGLIWAGPGTFAPKEVAKRIRLSMRDGEDGPPTEYELAFIPFLIVQACAEKHGISGAYGWEKTTKEDVEAGTCNADRFFNEMAYWKRALRWLPGDRAEKDKYTPKDNFNTRDSDGNIIGDELDYGNEMALLAEFYEAIISRMSKASSEESYLLARKNLNNTANRLNRFGHLNNSQAKFKFKVNSNESLEK